MSDSNTATFTAQLEDVEVRDSGAGPDQMTLRGHASVFDRLSHDLGGFRERVSPGAFRSVLDTNPDVHLVWDHDTSLTLARTKSNTLELREDPMGLHVWARLAPTSYAKDLAILMERGDIDQMSFKFTIDEEEWNEDSSGAITSTILRVGSLYDVTVTAQGAYPQTDAQLVRSRYEDAVRSGRAPQTERAVPIAADPNGSDETAASIAAPLPGGPEFELVRRRASVELARAKAI